MCVAPASLPTISEEVSGPSPLPTLYTWGQTGEGSKVCMATVKDADILRAVIERLRKRIEAGAATFLVKIKAHRGEPLNEGADDEADRGCQIGIEEARWNEPTGRTLFTWKSEKGITRRAVWGLGVRQAITKKAGWLTVAKEKAAGNRAWWKGWWQHWKWEKKVSQEEAQRALEESWWEDDETWDSINTGLKGQMEQQRASGLNAKPVHRTWTADFMLGGVRADQNWENGSETAR